MKLPKIEVFWQSVASPFLSVEDLATFELAIDNRDERRNLMLPIPIDETQPGDDELPPFFNPYMTLFSLNTNEATELTCEEMKIWCERRKIVLYNITLKYIPSYDRNAIEVASSSTVFDLFQHVRDLRVEDVAEHYLMAKKLFPKLHSLRKFCLLDEAIADIEVFALIRQVNANLTRSKDIYPGPCALEDLRLHVGGLSTRTLKYLVGNLTSIKKITLECPDTMKDDLVEVMAMRWTQLHHVDIYNTHLNDSAFEAFRRTQQRFDSIRLTDINDLTANGLKNLLWNSAASLTELSLYSIKMSDKDMTMLLQHCTAIRALSLEFMSDCSSIVLRSIAKRCPHLRQLKLRKLNDADKIRDADIQSLVQGCPHISKLHLSYFPSLSPKSVDMIDTAYAKIITRFWINDRKFMQKCRRSQFSTCPNRLIVDDDDEFDDG
jgi:hypothetical protein